MDETLLRRRRPVALKRGRHTDELAPLEVTGADDDDDDDGEAAVCVWF